jgi:hypothetical protein
MECVGGVVVKGTPFDECSTQQRRANGYLTILISAQLKEANVVQSAF